MAAVAGAYVVGVWLDLLEQTEVGEVGENGFSRFGGGHACVLAAVDDLRLVLGESALCLELFICLNVSLACHVAVICKYPYDRQAAALTYLVVVGVVGRCDLNNAGALFHVGMLVADDRDLLVEQRKDNMAAVEVLITLVLAVDRYGGVTEHCLGTGRGDFEHFARFLYGIENVPEVTLLFLVLDFSVGDRGVAVRTPVYHAVAAVDLAVLVELYKDLAYSLGAALVHCETLALPVAANAQLAQLSCDSAAVLALPFPRALEELLASEVVLGNALLAHSLNDFRLCRDGRVVGAGHPKRCIA